MRDHQPEELPYSVPSDEQMIWRYMDREKFELLTKNGALFFARASQFDDGFEGSYPPSQPEMDRILSLLPDDVAKNASQINAYELEGFAKWVRHWTFASCWHMNGCESEAMWKLYLKKQKGIVCIQSTFKRLRDSLSANALRTVFGQGQFHIGEIEYINYAEDTIGTKNILGPFFRKRREYSHERELRAVFVDFPLNKAGVIDREAVPNDKGRHIECNLETLVQKVIVFPSAPIQFRERIEKIMRTYSLQKPVLPSSLDDRPTF